MAAPTGLDTIPGPSGWPFVGNIFDIDGHRPIERLMELARQYGPIFRLSVPSGKRLIVSGVDLVDEICDDTRFDKLVTGGLAQLCNGTVGSGLFTSQTQDPSHLRHHRAVRFRLPIQLVLSGDPHPFVTAMVRTLAQAQERTNRLRIQTRMHPRAQRQVEEDQLKNPELDERAQAEVDEVLGTTKLPSYEQVHRLIGSGTR